MPHQFEATLSNLQIEGLGNWTVMFVPAAVQTALGLKGRLDVRLQFKGCTFQRTLLPSGDGQYFFVLNVAMRKQARIKVGDTVEVTLEPDETYSVVEVPDYFLAELEDFPDAKAEFEKSPPSMRRWIAAQLDEAKSMDTKANRVVKYIEVLTRRWHERQAKQARKKKPAAENEDT